MNECKCQPIEKETPDPRYFATCPIYDIGKRILTYGLYPQSHVKDKELIAKLEKIATSWNDWTLFEGYYYCKAKASIAEKESRFDDGEEIKNEEVYWFLCEPIEWKVFPISNDLCKAVSRLILDGRVYEEKNDEYGLSRFMKQLNKRFLKTAFVNRGILEKAPREEGNSDGDKVSLLSLEEGKKLDKGFMISTASDYAKAKRVRIDSETNHGLYWIGSAYPSEPGFAYYADYEGRVHSSSAGSIGAGFRPCIYMKLQIEYLERRHRK